MTKLLKIIPNVLAIFLLILTSCKEVKKSNSFKIGFSQCIGNDQWRIAMLKEMKRELSLHQNIEFIYRDAEGNSEKQVAQVKELVNEGIDLLLISPNEAQPLTEVVEQAMSNNIPVVVIDRKIATNNYTAYVGADNFKIGAIAGSYIGGSFTKGAKIIELGGLPSSSPAMERHKGFSKEVQANSNLVVIDRYHGNWLKEVASKQTEHYLKSFANADVVFAHNDQMALGVHEVLKKHGLQHRVKLIGIDALYGDGNGLDLIERGILQASILYPTGGQEAIRIAAKILSEQPFGKNNILKTTVIDISNVQLMKMQEERLDKQQENIRRQQNLLNEQVKIYRDQRFILNILVVSLVLAVVFGGIAFYSLTLNWKNNKILEQQNNEIIANEKQLRSMTDQAAEATEAKMQFFTNVSHEFRTPITLMLLPIQELLKEKNLSSQAKDRLLLLQRSARRILKMVNELIDFKKIGDAKMQLQLGKVDVVALVRDIVQAFDNAAKQKYIDLRVLTDKRSLLATVDLQLFDRVMFNLLANALKFTPKYGYVYVTIDSKDNLLSIKIEDSGIGMTAEELEHAFEPFYQGKNSGIQGSGLGLSLCRDIITLHQGIIDLKSEKGKGTVCQFEIPILPLEDFGITEVKNLINEEISKIYTDGIVEQQPNIDTSKKQLIHDKLVLVIEDNHDMRTFLADALSSNYNVLTAANGIEGFEAALDFVPDLIVSDVLMPEKDGIEVTKQLKSDFRTSHIPVILLTAQANDEQKLVGLNSLADSYMNKPFSMDLLLATIQNMLTNRAMLKQKFISDIPLNANKELGKLDKKFINDLSSIVETNLTNDNLSVDDIATAMGLSRVQLYRKAKAILDTPIAEYILNRRLQKAKYLLTNEKDLSIAEITFQTGFTSPNYFSTVFKAKYGVRPTEFKKGSI